MGKLLDQGSVDRYHEQGFVAPVRVMDEAAAAKASAKSGQVGKAGAKR